MIISINCLYRPPHFENHEDFLDESETFLNDLKLHKADVKIIASDLNFGNIYCKNPILPPKPLDASAPDIYASYGFSQLIDIPTRVTQSTVSLVDLIFVDYTDLVQCHGTLPQIADHDGVFVSLNVKRGKSVLSKKNLLRLQKC